MRAAILREYGDAASSLVCADMAVPDLKPGQVLVRIDAAPINPSDLAFIHGDYGFRKKLPTVPGFEGAGVVVKSNAGLYGKWLVGKRVACSAPEDGPGTWAEYAACHVSACVPLSKATSLEFGASLIVNPLTAIVLIDKARRAGAKALIQTAAGSALGRMIHRTATAQGIAVIDVVRRPEAASKLQAEGRTDVVASESPDFADRLRAACDRLKPTIALDAVAGAQTAMLAHAMPRGSKIIVFGGLSGLDPGLSLRNLIFEGKTLEGFWLPVHLRTTGLLKTLQMFRTIQRAGAAMFGTPVQARLPLAQVHDAIALQEHHATAGKVLLLPPLTEPGLPV